MKTRVLMTNLSFLVGKKLFLSYILVVGKMLCVLLGICLIECRFFYHVFFFVFRKFILKCYIYRYIKGTICVILKHFFIFQELPSFQKIPSFRSEDRRTLFLDFQFAICISFLVFMLHCTNEPTENKDNMGLLSNCLSFV